MSALDVVIVAYGNREVIGACVEGARQLPGVGEVVVVDHGHDGSGAVAAARGARVLSNPANPGFGTGQNRGVATTTARYVLLLNPDADPDPEGIAAGIRALDADPQVAIVQGVIANRVTGQPERSQGRELGPVHLLGRAVSARRLLAYAWVRRVFGRVGILADHVERTPTRPVSVESLAATCVLVRRRALDQIGGFDESYFLYGEDLDLCRRLRNGGWRLVALPHRFAQHDGGAVVEHVDRARALVVARHTAVLGPLVVGPGLDARDRRGHHPVPAAVPTGSANQPTGVARPDGRADPGPACSPPGQVR